MVFQSFLVVFEVENYCLMTKILGCVFWPQRLKTDLCISCWFVMLFCAIFHQLLSILSGAVSSLHRGKYRSWLSIYLPLTPTIYEHFRPKRSRKATKNDRRFSLSLSLFRYSHPVASKPKAKTENRFSLRFSVGSYILGVRKRIIKINFNVFHGLGLVEFRFIVYRVFSVKNFSPEIFSGGNSENVCINI